MPIHIALLRGINVGGNNKLPMADLRDLCEGAGFQNVRTYIQSGNVLFESEKPEENVIEALEQALQASMGKHIAVIVRTAEEMEAVLSNTPFPGAKPSFVGVLFFCQPVPQEIFNGFSTPGPEEIVVSKREIYIHYPDGMGRSKLKLPKIPEPGTIRNINTVSKLVSLSREIPK